MTAKITNYVAKTIDENGNAAYTADENQVWQELITRQQAIVKNRGCNEYLKGLDLLDLPQNRIPQCHEISKVLRDITGWTLEPVPALISFDHFFKLLANRKFPAATFIRRKEELDYLQEPDIFHEIFGHCPLLTNPAYAEFTHMYGKLGVNATHEERVLLARIFWFTIEFGLMKTPQGLRAYGGGILSSINETVYSIESDVPKRVPFDLFEALATPYRIDVIQPIYFVINNFDELYNIIEIDLMDYIRKNQFLIKEQPKHPC